MRQARGQLSAWLQAWRDAAARRKTPSFTRLHAVLDKVPSLSGILTFFASKDGLDVGAKGFKVVITRHNGQALKDVKRGNVVEDDVEGWTPKRVAAWITSCNPALAKYASSFIDEQVTGKRLVRLFVKRCLWIEGFGKGVCFE